MRRFGFVVTIALLSLLVTVPATATHLDVVDLDDTSGPLDVSRVITRGETWRPIWRISTYNRWTARRIWDTGYLLVWLDTFGTDRYDYYVLVRSTGSRLQALLFRDRINRPDRLVSTLTRWRPDDRTVSVLVPLSKVSLPETRTYYRWAVQTLYTGDICRRVCMDFAPDMGAVREQVRGLAAPAI